MGNDEGRKGNTMITAKELADMVMRLADMEGETNVNGTPFTGGDCLDSIRTALKCVALQEGWTE